MGEVYTVSIFTVTGSEVLKSTLSLTQEEIDISSLPTGFYFIQVRNKSEIISIEKLVKGL